MVKAWARALSLARAKGLWWQRTNGLGYDVIRGNLTDDVMQACAVRARHIELNCLICFVELQRFLSIKDFCTFYDTTSLLWALFK